MAFDKFKINRTLNLESQKIISGFTLSIAERFNFCKAFYNGQEITNQVYDSRVYHDNIEFNVRNLNKLNVRANDSLDLYFVDERKLILDISGIKRVRINVDKIEEPCDTISYIIYDNIKDNIEDIITKESVSIKQLYSLTLENEIEEYIQTLSQEERSLIAECTDEYFILDFVDDDNEFGFSENEYDLTDKIRSFLDIIASSINFHIAQQEWSLTDFRILITGFADERTYTGDGKLNFNNIKYIGTNDLILPQNCNRKTFISISTPKIINPLRRIKDNCDLTVVRAFNAAKYFEYKFGQFRGEKIDILYNGEGELTGSNYQGNRKIDIHLELKSISKRASSNNNGN
ncbi:MAG: hypothetical protein P1U56_23665 [Saprospiraceae bacterium]|nr:hypothetical protein [Saprospiraceae bacterium]